MRNLTNNINKINKEFNRKIAKMEKARARAIAKAVMETERAAFRLQNQASRMLDAAREATEQCPGVAEAVRLAHASREARSRREYEKLLAARAAKRAAADKRAADAAKHTAANRAAKRAADAKPTVDAVTADEVARMVRELFDIDIE